MKKIILAAIIFLSISVSAQIKEGRIVYERVFTLPIRSFNVDPAIAEQIPKTRTEQFELLFANNQSLWQYLPSANSEPNTFEGPGMVVRFNSGTNDIVYANLEKGTSVMQTELMERNYVVADSIRKQNWKLSEETKTILNHTVRKATSQRIRTRMQMSMENGVMKREPVQDTSAVVAWFTTDIPVSVGPEFQGQLPGAILELDIANGQTIYRAIELSPKVSINKIKEPKEGKKLTEAQFAQEREKMMEEMRRNRPAGGNFRIQN